MQCRPLSLLAHEPMELPSIMRVPRFSARDEWDWLPPSASAADCMQGGREQHPRCRRHLSTAAFERQTRGCELCLMLRGWSHLDLRSYTHSTPSLLLPPSSFSSSHSSLFFLTLTCLRSLAHPRSSSTTTQHARPQDVLPPLSRNNLHSPHPPHPRHHLCPSNNPQLLSFLHC